MRGWVSIIAVLATVLPLAACDTPPESALYKAKSGASGVPIGNNASGEACTLVGRGGGGADVYCGAWQQPSARIRLGGNAGDVTLTALATTSQWRLELESRFACGEPRPDGTGSLVLQCSRRAGGWAQVALATSAGGKAWLADGTPAAFPVIQRSIAQLSGGGTTTGGGTTMGGAALGR